VNEAVELSGTNIKIKKVIIGIDGQLLS